ncbi:MAG: type I-U CRISPR-associated protein Csx17 [Cyanobacteria bacterium MAG IRC1_bin_28]|nr:type I-U CRISPR-associated protein Csx17 [Cyanobacteria bacterium MAG IRC3_bin_20]MCY3654891.1 type I-U CRISPR-associated protein Csx17 [Cyanobacteria bacterium MAG IRC1_bin_28]MDE0647864.1 type I-U CRISPR-associated protein Csx17 [Cyanobacteria bacterium MAG IRC4_bin_6]
MIHIHHLDGCAPTPLAHYLKALGILRLVAEQADPEARGWWDGDRFCLATTLGAKKIESFFLHDYQPTPMFNPWGGRSGYYNGKSEKSARESLEKIEKSQSDRLKSFCTTIEVVRRAISDMTPADELSKKNKEELIPALRLSIRGKASLWLDTVVALIGAGDEMSWKQPPIFGTGGNEGSRGYPSLYMSAIVESVIEKKWNHVISYVLFGKTIPKCHWDQSMGQFAPGSVSTPWDILLAFEGACMLTSSVAQKGSTHSKRWMSSPFYVAPRSAGYASNSRLDERLLNKGRESAGRGEQWLPIWTKPSCYTEVQQIFTQGRAATKVGRATDGWTMARAVSSFGVSRGIAKFIRYGYQQRNNQATHFAVPLGYFHTPDVELKTTAKSSCLDDLDYWLGSLHSKAHPSDDKKAKTVPSRMVNTYGRLMDALFAVINKDATYQMYQRVLLCLGDIEAIMRQGTGHEAQPVPLLRPEWVVASNDGSPEFRLALAFALQEGGHGKPGFSAIRRHWLPLDREKPWRFATSGNGLDMQPEVVMHGRRGLDDAIALVQRRLVEASQHGGRHLPLNAARQAFASIADLTALLTGGVDLDRTLVLARALMALDHKAWAAWSKKYTMEQPHDSEWPDDPWLAIRLCTLPWPLRMKSGFELDIGADPELVRRLATGDATTAFVIASRRLRAAGVRCTIRSGAAPPETARLWAAALAFPITETTAKRFLSHLDPSKERPCPST